MRPHNEIQMELASLEQALLGFEQSDIQPFGVQMMHESLLDRREDLRAELIAATTAGLRMIIEGEEVVDHSVDVEYLVKTLGPLQRAVQAVAQSLLEAATTAGRIPTVITNQSRMRILGTFAGSFGIELAGPPRPDTGVLTLPGFPEEEPIFERSMSKILDVLEAAADLETYEQAVVNELAEIGTRTTTHLTDFAKAVASSSSYGHFSLARHNKRQREVTFGSQSAQRLQSVLTSIESSETNQPVSGRLVEASLPGRTFGISTAVDEPLIKGRVASDIAYRIEDYFGKEVVGTMRVIKTRSTISGKTATKYELLEVNGPLEG